MKNANEKIADRVRLQSYIINMDGIAHIIWLQKKWMTFECRLSNIQRFGVSKKMFGNTLL